LPSDGARRIEIDYHTVDQHIPPELHYSCRYWVYHLVKCNPLRNLFDQVYVFLEEHFLHWVEAMSLLGFASEVVGMLSLLQKYIPVCPEAAYLEVYKIYTNKKRAFNILEYPSFYMTQNGLS